ncbi:MAG: hypothetical protein COA33_009505 [Fluviicola sp.]|nr:hypothetical protein [Fluviicola sp.]
MRLFVYLLVFFAPFAISAQNVVPMLDFNYFFKNFKDGFFQQIEIQRIEEFKAGDNLVAYVDFRGNLIVYDGVKKMSLANLQVEYQVSDRLMTWKIGNTLNMWDNGQTKTLSFTNRNYWVKDNIIVFDDMQYNSVNVYYNGTITTLYTSVGDVDPPDFIGENIIAYRDNGNFNKVFWKGRVYDLEVWHNPFDYQAGTDILCFNDPMSGTFAVFENGQFLDVEEFHVGKYRAGRGFILYENRNNDLMYYSQGIRKQLTNYGADWWQVVDDVAVWTENGFAYALVEGVKYDLANYIPEEIILKNDVIAFRNIMGGVSALVNGKVVELTTQIKSTFSIYGSSVLIELFNRSYIVYSNGRKYSL